MEKKTESCAVLKIKAFGRLARKQNLKNDSLWVVF